MSGERRALPLQEDLRAGRIERALLCHVHDRWYLGELFCHASWVSCLRAAGIACSVCTNAAYLELFEHQPGVLQLYPAERLDDALRGRFDLVVFATTHPPTSYANRLPRAIFAWNDGIALARYGQVEFEVATPEPNLFAATCHRHGQTALPDGEYFALHLTADERTSGSRWLDDLLDDAAGPVVVFNPTASNAHTRATARPKAVENTLGVDDCERLVGHLLAELPDHRVLIAAPLKPGDRENHAALLALGERFAGERRLLSRIGEIDIAKGFSLRAFSAVLADDRIRGILGNSTGSNAHLAAALNVPAVSIERGADEEMRRNWRSPRRGQMGSFRWRNPHPCTAAFPLRWQSRTSVDCGPVARLLRRHMTVRESGWAASLGVDAALSGALARDALAELSAAAESSPSWGALRRFAELLDVEQRELAYDFCDEAEYFRATGRDPAAAWMEALTAIGGERGGATRRGRQAALDPSERALVAGMVATSNLLKDLRAAVGADEPGRWGDAKDATVHVSP